MVRFRHRLDLGRQGNLPQPRGRRVSPVAFDQIDEQPKTRQRDLSEIARLKQNNDVMRTKLLAAIAERDHYLAALRRHGIDAGPAPVPAAAPTAAAPSAGQNAPSPEPTAADSPTPSGSGGDGSS